MMRIYQVFTNMIRTILLTSVLLAGCVAGQSMPHVGTNATIPPQRTANSDVILVWEGQPLNAATADACGRLQVNAAGTATVSACGADDGTTQGLNDTHAQEWATMQTRVAAFHAETAHGTVTFNGTGTSAAAAWQRAIGAWAQLVYTELSGAQVSATGAMVLNWQIGAVPDGPTRCRRLIVLSYGYAYARAEPCAGGAAEEITGGWLNDSALIALAHWQQKLAPLYVENNYLAGYGETEASAVAQQVILAWVVATYNELAGQGSATGPIAMRWLIGESAENAALCQQLTVLRYGYGYAEVVPCAGGPPVQQTAGLLTEEELEPLLGWLVRFAPVDTENNYLDGVGSRQADGATVAAMAAWATQLYSRLTITPADTEAGANPVAQNLRTVLTMQLGLLEDKITIVAASAVTWSDGCLGLGSPVESCLMAETPGYRIVLAVSRDEYVYHTDKDGAQVRLAAAPDPQLGNVLVELTLNDERGCNTIQMSRAALAFGSCLRTMMRVPLHYVHRQAELTEFAATFASFTAETGRGRMQFNGTGPVAATAAQQRMLAEWAQLVASEVRFGSSGPNAGMILAWQWTGGSAGFCDDLVLTRTGEGFPSSCKGQGAEPESVRLNAEELALIYTWVDTFASFHYEWRDPAQAAGMTVTLDFFGNGTETATAPEQVLIVDFAQKLFHEGYMTAAAPFPTSP